jgi:hypothetical protein
MHSYSSTAAVAADFDLLTPETFSSWLPAWEEASISFGDHAMAIRSKARLLRLSYPSADDMILDAHGDDTDMQKYEHGDTGMTRTGRSQFAQDIRDWNLRAEKDATNAAGLLSHLFRHMSPASKTLLKNHPGYAAAAATNDVFAIFFLVEATHVAGNSRNTFRHVADFLSLEQGTGAHSFELLLEGLRLGEGHLTREFQDDAHPGCIRISWLVGLVFANAVDKTRFQFPLDKLFSENPSGKLDEPWTVIQGFQAFAHQNDVAPPSEPTAAYAAATTSSPPPSAGPAQPCSMRGCIKTCGWSNKRRAYFTTCYDCSEAGKRAKGMVAASAPPPAGLLSAAQQRPSYRSALAHQMSADPAMALTAATGSPSHEQIAAIYRMLQADEAALGGAYLSDPCYRDAHL